MPGKRVDLDPANIRFTQKTVSGKDSSQAMMDDIAAKGFDGEPITVVEAKGHYVSIDNRRLVGCHRRATAGHTDTVPCIVYPSDERLPDNQLKRFGLKPGATWGMAVDARTNSYQNQPRKDVSKKPGYHYTHTPENERDMKGPRGIDLLKCASSSDDHYSQSGDDHSSEGGLTPRKK